MFKSDKLLRPAAFEQRNRDRERRRLIAELEGLDEQQRYDGTRRPVLLGRLNTLNRDDLAATLKACRADARTFLQDRQAAFRGFREPPPSVDSFVYSTSPRDALKPDLGNRRFFAVGPTPNEANRDWALGQVRRVTRVPTAGENDLVELSPAALGRLRKDLEAQGNAALKRQTLGEFTLAEPIPEGARVWDTISKRWLTATVTGRLVDRKDLT
jgi:hypothetical protein